MTKYSLFPYLSILAIGCMTTTSDQMEATSNVVAAVIQAEHDDSDASPTANILAIIKLKSQYSFAVDLVTKDPSQINQLTDLMADDIVVDYGPSGVYTGKTAVANFFQNILPQAVAWGFHMPLNPIINVTSPKAATGDWYVHALGVYKSAYAAGPLPVFGRYHDTYVRTSDGWRFKTITLTLDTPPTGP